LNRKLHSLEIVKTVLSYIYVSVYEMQYEGAVEEGGRSLSIWDNFTHAFPGSLSTSSMLLNFSINYFCSKVIFI